MGEYQLNISCKEKNEIFEKLVGVSSACPDPPQLSEGQLDQGMDLNDFCGGEGLAELLKGNENVGKRNDLNNVFDMEDMRKELENMEGLENGDGGEEDENGNYQNGEGDVEDKNGIEEEKK